jgi:ubiquinone/menaquinone biosynthesis C-methylase UbiE
MSCSIDMRDPTPSTRTYYDAFSERYDDPRSGGYHRLLDDLEWNVVEPLAVGRRVLEVGCGTGLILRRIAERADEAWGVDLSHGMLRRANRRGLRVVLGSATAIPFPEASFDLVCSFKVLAHVREIGAALREIARVTRPGGQMALEFYNPWSLRYLAKRLAGPRATGHAQTEADVYTRWDTPTVIPRLLPPGVVLEGWRGVRVVTPFAGACAWPGIGRVLTIAEHAATDSPLRWFGGFLIALLRKRA